MKTLNRDAVKELHSDIMSALGAVATKHGVTFNYKGATFNTSNALFKVEAAVVDANTGTAETRERQDFKLHAFHYGMNPDWLDQTFVFNNKTFRITGLSTRKHKNPVLIAEVNTGKRYKISADLVKLHYKAQNQVPVVPQPAI